MSALSANDSRLHTADTATDNRNFLCLLGGLNVILLGLHGLGIECTTGKTHGVGQILGIGMALGGREVEATAVAADAGLDIIQSVLNQLGDPLGVNQELAGNTDRVNSAVGNGLCTDLGIHSTCTNYGNVHKLLDVCYVIQVAVLGHIHRGMCPVPGVIRTVVSVEHIVARILQVLGRLFGLLHSATYLGVNLTGHCALAEALHLGLNRVTEGYGVILTASLLDGLNDLGGKAVAVLKASTVFIGTLVEELDGKLVEEVALMHGVNLNTVNACLLAKLCGLGERLNDLVDLLNRHLGALNIVCPAGGLRRGASELV